MKKSILIVDDSPNIRTELKALLEYEGYEVTTAESGETGLKLVSENSFNAILLDVKLPGMDGLETLTEIKKVNPLVKVIMISGHADLEIAVQATRLGAYNFFQKPLKPEKVLLELKNIVDHQQLESEMNRLRTIIDLDYQMIGTSPVMQQLYEDINRAAPSDGRIFIYGENGTGKELVAREIHRKSNRANKPFVQVNCAAIPKELIESELFGYEKGAFTGAIKRKTGVFEEAHGGTLLLDEIGDMALETQSKLLRVLQQNEFMRVGGTKMFKFDVRIISATNKDLQREITQGNFREDLYFRINVIPIRVPRLNERKEDIPLLIRHFIESYCKKNGKPVKKISEDALYPFLEYHWPGNIRQLKNMIERFVIMSDNTILTQHDVSELLPELAPKTKSMVAFQTDDYVDQENELSLREYVEQFEKKLFRHYFKDSNGNVSRMAEKLRTDRANLHRKLKKYGIK